MQSATFMGKDLYPSPVPGGEFCAIVKQIMFMKFRLWETFWNNTV